MPACTVVEVLQLAIARQHAAPALLVKLTVNLTTTGVACRLDFLVLRNNNLSGTLPNR